MCCFSSPNYFDNSESLPARHVLSGNIGLMNVATRCNENETPSALEPKGNVLAISGKRFKEGVIGVKRKNEKTVILEQPTSNSSATPRDGSKLPISPLFSSSAGDVLGAKLGWTRLTPGGKEKQTSSSIMEPKDNVHFANNYPKPRHPVLITEVPSIGQTGCVLR